MRILSFENKSRTALTVGAILGAASGIWLWWAVQANVWTGILMTVVAGALFSFWLHLQGCAGNASSRHQPILVALSWACIIIAAVTTAVFFAIMPVSVEPNPAAKEAASNLAAQFIIPQALASFCGLASLWGLRAWKPLGVLVRSAVGIGIACFSAYHFLLTALFVNMGH